MDPRAPLALGGLFLAVGAPAQAAGLGTGLPGPSESYLMLLLGSCLVGLAGYSRRSFERRGGP